MRAGRYMDTLPIERLADLRRDEIDIGSPPIKVARHAHANKPAP
jgi:hypothetical protein